MGAITSVQDDDGWLLAAGRGFAYLSVDGTLLPVAEEVAPGGTRMNDAACDPEGRPWAGTLAHDHHAGGGALYRLDRDGQTELVLEGLTISNGLRATEDWSDEQRRAEPTAGLTYRFDSDATGQPAAPFLFGGSFGDALMTLAIGLAIQSASRRVRRLRLEHSSRPGRQCFGGDLLAPTRTLSVRRQTPPATWRRPHDGTHRSRPQEGTTHIRDAGHR